MSALPPAGWYPDPENDDQQRYWDGTQWTDHRAPAAGAAADTGVSSSDTGVTPSGDSGDSDGGLTPTSDEPSWSSPEPSSSTPSWESTPATPAAAGSGGAWSATPAGGQAWGTGGGQPTGQPPQTWLWQSIVATLLCCLPAGVVGIIYAAQANSAVSAGNYAEAEAKAKTAKTWTLVSVGIGVVGVILWILFMVFAGISSSSMNGF